MKYETKSKAEAKHGKSLAVKEENVAGLLADRDQEWGGKEEESKQQEPKPPTTNGKKKRDAERFSSQTGWVCDNYVNVVDEETKTDLNDSFEDWNGAEMKSCDDLVYKMTLTNT